MKKKVLEVNVFFLFANLSLSPIKIYVCVSNPDIAAKRKVKEVKVVT